MVLYGGCILIYIRSVFRLVEYAQGNAGWLIRQEWTFYVFDAMVMIVTMVLFNAFHPSTIKVVLEESLPCQKTTFQGLHHVVFSSEVAG
jgi:hypothetical protein